MVSDSIISSELVTTKTTSDSLIDVGVQSIKEILAVADSTSIKDLKDNEFASEIDKKWFEELYNNTLFDTIYKSVTELTFEEIDFKRTRCPHTF